MDFRSDAMKYLLAGFQAQAALLLVPGDWVTCEDAAVNNPCRIMSLVAASHSTGRALSLLVEDSSGEEWNVVASKCRPYRRA